MYSKNYGFPCFCSQDTPIYATVPPIQVGWFRHLIPLDYRQCPKCIVFMLMPLCNQACNTAHVTWYERQRFLLDVDTTTFVEMHPCEEKKRWLQGLFDPPSYMTLEVFTGINEYTLTWNPVQSEVSNTMCGIETVHAHTFVEDWVLPLP